MLLTLFCLLIAIIMRYLLIAVIFVDCNLMISTVMFVDFHDVGSLLYCCNVCWLLYYRDDCWLLWYLLIAILLLTFVDCCNVCWLLYYRDACWLLWYLLIAILLLMFVDCCDICWLLYYRDVCWLLWYLLIAVYLRIWKWSCTARLWSLPVTKIGWHCTMKPSPPPAPIPPVYKAWLVLTTQLSYIGQSKSHQI